MIPVKMAARTQAPMMVQTVNTILSTIGMGE
jgi:hypothetical protein